ncbi:Transposon Ty3-G Gag-Pol polyprotein [Senna tora]|uniref:Transposon Ty3-G Gag-Pol polyprotein n=1 Tax=Senna tora TaxID=362788 RepID=A0A834TKG8_9FABA|nr:Transposon Ty3-G Gag-Pol polyprotein [Senna tora]
MEASMKKIESEKCEDSGNKDDFEYEVDKNVVEGECLVVRRDLICQIETHVLNEQRENIFRTRCLVKNKVCRYCDEILCDVVPMHVGHILLGRPWELDRKAKKNRNLLMCSLKKFHPVYHLLEELNIKSISFEERQFLIISL